MCGSKAIKALSAGSRGQTILAPYISKSAKTMPSRRPIQSALPSEGSKIIFDETAGDLDPDLSQLPTSPHHVSLNESGEEDEGSDDEAPEAVGLDKVKDNEEREVQLEEQYALLCCTAFTNTFRAKRTKRDAASMRSRKIAAIKAQPRLATAKIKGLSEARGSKRKRLTRSTNDEEEQDDPEAKRLTVRMEKAMEDGEGETDDDSDLDKKIKERTDDANEEDSEEKGSFHTHSEGGSDRSEELDDSESERLLEGPIDDETKQLRVKMQAAMEANERRALGEGGITSFNNPQTKKVDDKGTEDGLYDLGPLPITGRALPASVLRAAAVSEAERKVRKAREAYMAQVGHQNKRTRRRMKSRSGPQAIEKDLT